MCSRRDFPCGTWYQRAPGLFFISINIQVECPQNGCFSFQKYGKIWSFLLCKLIKHWHLISKEWHYIWYEFCAMVFGLWTRVYDVLLDFFTFEYTDMKSSFVAKTFLFINLTNKIWKLKINDTSVNNVTTQIYLPIPLTYMQGHVSNQCNHAMARIDFFASKVCLQSLPWIVKMNQKIKKLQANFFHY